MSRAPLHRKPIDPEVIPISAGTATPPVACPATQRCPACGVVGRPYTVIEGASTRTCVMGCRCRKKPRPQP